MLTFHFLECGVEWDNSYEGKGREGKGREGKIGEIVFEWIDAPGPRQSYV